MTDKADLVRLQGSGDGEGLLLGGELVGRHHHPGLGRRFGVLAAVDDISLDIADGTLLALLGPNGAGKTTTVRMLSGLLAPTVGSATFRWKRRASITASHILKAKRYRPRR